MRSVDLIRFECDVETQLGRGAWRSAAAARAAQANGQLQPTDRPNCNQTTATNRRSLDIRKCRAEQKTLEKTAPLS